ncbi:hypothetical protein KQX54_010920 [Cotesia glomerata]|uniref:Uncharacterized protein n=1 Tax=Cotesia glomerata TaxID=32391 RepID=A0AAV7I2T2_COTGL|nr:hypothetical protein KQX54_010920 [Cotesia glomerata]
MNPNDLYLPKGKLLYSRNEFTEWCEKLQAKEHPTKLSGFDIKTITAAKLKRFMDPALFYYKFHKKCEFFGNALELIDCNWSQNHPPHFLPIAPEPNDIIQPTETTAPETTKENRTNESNSEKLLHILGDIDNYPFLYANDSIVFDEAIEIINELVPTVDGAIEEAGHIIAYRPFVEVNNEEIRSLAIGSISEEAGRRDTKIVKKGAEKPGVQNFDEITRNLEVVFDIAVEGSSGEILKEKAGGFGRIIETTNRGSNGENPEKAAEHLEAIPESSSRRSSVENLDKIARSLEATVDIAAEGSSGEIPKEQAGDFELIIETKDRGSGDENPDDAAEHRKATDDTIAKGSSDEITEENFSSKSVAVTVLSKTEANINDSKIVEISSIEIAQKKHRGRPKGKVLSAIGLLIGRVSKKINKNYNNATLTAFINLDIKLRIEIIIMWVTKTSDIMATVMDKSYKITTADIREKLPDSLMDDENFHCVYEYFEKAAIQNLKQAINKKKKIDIHLSNLFKKSNFELYPMRLVFDILS